MSWLLNFVWNSWHFPAIMTWLSTPKLTTLLSFYFNFNFLQKKNAHTHTNISFMVKWVQNPLDNHRKKKKKLKEGVEEEHLMYFKQQQQKQQQQQQQLQHKHF